MSTDRNVKIFYNQYIKPELNKLRPGGISQVGKTKQYGIIAPKLMAKDYFQGKHLEVSYFPISNQPLFITNVINKYSPYDRFISHR